MMHLVRALAPALFAFAFVGCGGCQGGGTPPPASTPTAAAVAAPTEVAPDAAAPAAGDQDGEIDCFVIVDAEPDFGGPPLVVNFTTETDCTADPVTYSWDFGDGSKGGNEANPSHTYTKPGDYVATVTTTAPDGGHGTDEIDITVDAELAD